MKRRDVGKVAKRLSKEYRRNKSDWGAARLRMVNRNGSVSYTYKRKASQSARVRPHVRKGKVVKSYVRRGRVT